MTPPAEPRTPVRPCERARPYDFAQMSIHTMRPIRLSWLRHILRSTHLRVLVALMLLGMVVIRLGLSIFLARLRHADPEYAVGVVVVALVIGLYRWRGSLSAAGIHLPASDLGHTYGVSTFPGTFRRPPSAETSCAHSSWLGADR